MKQNSNATPDMSLQPMYFDEDAIEEKTAAALLLSISKDSLMRLLEKKSFIKELKWLDLTSSPVLLPMILKWAQIFEMFFVSSYQLLIMISHVFPA